ncbi:hypothetical protein EGR_11014 [Echinococcus granulosus]|uniref:Uncharacterized protein n=1 Tax=Echinococcus granulosus TaxID=6210 RepID=W6U6X4_ECHGR|nr:hypothetical protein EGR_11014 [Echinococcus granulosus]EUB54127.1 hypothetical protein EGR_11014 [Echinococcus granulosus]
MPTSPLHSYFGDQTNVLMLHLTECKIWSYEKCFSEKTYGGTTFCIFLCKNITDSNGGVNKLEVEDWQLKDAFLLYNVRGARNVLLIRLKVSMQLVYTSDHSIAFSKSKLSCCKHPLTSNNWCRTHPCDLCFGKRKKVRTLEDVCENGEYITISQEYSYVQVMHLQQIPNSFLPLMVTKKSNVRQIEGIIGLGNSLPTPKPENLILSLESKQLSKQWKYEYKAISPSHHHNRPTQCCFTCASFKHGDGRTNTKVERLCRMVNAVSKLWNSVFYKVEVINLIVSRLTLVI